MTKQNGEEADALLRLAFIISVRGLVQKDGHLIA